MARSRASYIAEWRKNPEAFREKRRVKTKKAQDAYIKRLKKKNMRLKSQNGSFNPRTGKSEPIQPSPFD